MPEELFSYSEVQNLGFFTNPNLQDAQLKAMSRREQLLQGAYYYANSDRDDECRTKSAEIFGRGTIPLSDKENSAYFLGHAVLLESGYTGSPFQYFLQQNMDLPPDVVDEDTARIHIGNKVLNNMRAAYDERKKAEEELTAVQNELPTHLANLVTDHMWGEGSKRQESINALASIGAWDKMEPSINRARAAFRPLMYRTPSQIQEALEREQLADIADMLSDEKGQLDELAVTAFAIAMAKHAESFQSKGESIPDTLGATASAAGLSFSEFLRRDDSAEEKKRLQQRLDLVLAIGDYETADQVGRLIDAKTERIRGIMMNALSTSIAPSEQAGAIAKTIIESGRLAGDSVIPMAAAIAATSVSRGRGGWAMLGRAFAGWAGGLAVSKDSIIDMAVAQAYVEGKANPEEYGYYAGLGQVAAENIAGTGPSAFLAFGAINRFMTKAAAKATTTRLLSNAYARATLAWAATTGIEGTLELSEEEIGSWLGSKFNAAARSLGSDVSEQKHDWGATISQMKPHQIASMYVFAGALGLGGAAANFAAAQEISTDIGKLKAVGHSDEKAREVVANGIQTAQRIEEVNNSNATDEEKKAQITKIKDERLEYLGKAFTEDVINASEEEIKRRSEAENKEFTYRSLLALAIQNGLDEQALINLGYMGAQRQPNGNYLLTYEEKGEGENAQPKLIQKEWTRNQLTGFLLFQRGSDVHMKLRELQGQLMAIQFAEKVASVEELKIQLANLRDIPVTELSTIMQHEAITPELFKEFADKEIANIAADIANGMTRAQAAMQPSNLLPGVARKDVIGTATAAEQRKENAIAKGEIKPGQAVEYPGLNISRLDGTSLVAFFNQKISLPQMLEEMMEARLNQQAKNDPELYNKLGTILQSIQSKLKGVRILPKGKTSFTRGDIVEAYSHLAVAEFIANPAYISHLSQQEQAVVQDVLGSVFRAQRYKAIAGAWLNYKESEEGKAYLENGGKDIVDIFRDAGFTFGKHMEAVQATEQQKVKALEARNFLPDFTQEAKLLENKAAAEQELAEVNAQEAKQPTVIPANESVTGEEIVITPEQKEAEQATTIDQPQPDTSSWSKAEQVSYNAYQNIINGTAKVNDYAIYLYYNPMSDAEATQRGIRTLNQNGEENPMYTQGKRLSIFRDGKYSHADGQDRDVLTGEVRTKDIVHSPEVPQFKTNKSGHKADEKGVVYSLPGDYRMHDPIHIWQRTDGTLVVISGRHRLQKAIEAGAEFIPATVFPEVTGRDAEWARMHDFEQNVLDNQASVADTALYVQGVNPKNRKLTEDETKQFTRKGSNSEYGTYIGLHGSSELIAYLAGGVISPDYAYQIAQIAPDNQAAQKVAIEVLVFGDKGIMEAKNAEKIYLENQQLRGTELFQSLGGAERQEAFMRFLSAYAANKIRMLGRGKRPHSAAKSDKSIREHEAAGIKFEDAANNRAKLSELNAAQEAWRNVGTHPELLEEAKAEFEKTDEGAQQYFDFGANFSIQAAERVCNNFNNVRKAKPISIDTPSAFQTDIKEAIKSVRENYRTLQNHPVTMKDGKIVRFGKGGFNEIKNHAADRRVIAVIPQLKELCESAEYMYSATNSERHKPKKADITQYHYYLNKASFSGHAKDAYILIAVAERNTGEFFYDLDATDIETIDSIEGTTDALVATRVPNSEQQGSVPKSRIQNLKEFVNHWEQVFSNNPANFSIQAASLPDRFAGNPLAERMSNFMRTEARRYERTLNLNSPDNAAVNAIAATQAIIHSLDKYVRNGEFRLPREAMTRLKHMRALIEKYAQMMKSGKIRSFTKIDKAEQSELLAAMAEAAADIDMDSINTMTPEEFEALRSEVAAELMPELYRKHARALADDVAKSNLPEKEKERTLSALHRIIKEGRLAKNTTLDKPEQRQLTELVEAEAQDAIEKEARSREFKLTIDKMQQDNKARNERMVRVAATGRIGELLRDMLNETADIVDLYLKSELLKKLKRITDAVKIKRTPSKKLIGKMGAAEYRRMDAIVELMEMSARAKDNALGEIENARRILNESKGEIPEVTQGSLLWEIINDLNEQGITVSVDMLNVALNNREADINVFANLDGMNYAEALNAARGLAALIYFGRTAWQMKQAAEYERIKSFLDYFYKHTDSRLGTSQEIDKGKKKKLGNIFDSSMNDAQLLFALSGHEGLRPVMDEMRRNLAMAQDARNLHIKAITNQIYATYARLIGMKPQTEAGYTDTQLREASNKFSLAFEKWNQTEKTGIIRTWVDSQGVVQNQEMELTRMQALDLILTYRQTHYYPNADKHGFTESILNKLEEYCGTRLMAMGEAFKRTIQNDGTAKVYEERTGIPMSFDPTYWPGSININTINLTTDEPLVNPYNPAGAYHRLKQRVKHTNEAQYQNAFEKWKHAIAEGANYIYLYPITNTLNRMLAHREFANRLRGLIGDGLFNQLRLMLNVLDSSTWQETALRDEANNWAASMLKATAPAVLALNPGTLARQLSAINNYAMLPGIRIWRLPALIALVKQDKSAIKLSDIMQLDSFRARYRDNAEVNDMLGLGPNAKFSTYNKWAKAGMNLIDRLDIWSNAVSACLYYNMLYEELQEKNKSAENPLSEEEIRKLCEQNVAQLLRLVAQPLEKANKSAMYWKYGSTWMGSIFLYMSTEMVNKAGMLRATYIKNRSEGMPFHKNAWQLMYKMGLGLGGMTFLIEAGLFLLLSGDLPDDEKEWLAAAFSLAIYSAFGQYLSRIPFIGSVTDYYLSPYGQYTSSRNQQQNPALSIDKTSAKLLKMMSDNKHYSVSEWQVAYTRFVRDLTAVSGLASGLVPQAQWISTTTATLQSLSAAMNTVYPVARSVQMDSWMRDITPDWYKPKKTKKRTKSALEEALTPEPEKTKKGKKSK